jgi:hypothetical protein
MSIQLVKEALAESKAIAWDGCHKIYILMDDNQVELTRSYGYDPLIESKDSTPEQLFETLSTWYRDSCGLRFVQSVTTHKDPNCGFNSIIDQGEEVYL